MFYFPRLSSGYKRDEYLGKVLRQLKEIKPNIDSLVEWDKTNVDEYNFNNIDKNFGYDKNYLELQRIVNKLLEEDVK